MLWADGEATHLRQSILLVIVVPSNSRGQVILLRYVMLLYIEEMNSYIQNITSFCTSSCKIYMSTRTFGNKNHCCSTGVGVVLRHKMLNLNNNTNAGRKFSLHCIFIKDKSRPHSSVIHS